MAIALSACATGPIQFDMPTTQGESPEVAGRTMGAQIRAQTTTNRNIRLANDYGYDAVATFTPSLTRASGDVLGGVVGAAGELGLTQRFSVGLKSIGGPWSLSGKYQFLGEPRTTSGPGNFSMSMGASFGTTETKDEANYTSRKASYSLSHAQLGLILLMGYRVTQEVLLFVGGGYTHLSYEGEQTLFSTAKSNFSGTGYQLGCSGGIEIGVPLGDRPEGSSDDDFKEVAASNVELFFRGEAGYSDLKVQNQVLRGMSAAGSVGIHF